MDRLWRKRIDVKKEKVIVIILLFLYLRQLNESKKYFFIVFADIFIQEKWTDLIPKKFEKSVFFKFKNKLKQKKKNASSNSPTTINIIRSKNFF